MCERPLKALFNREHSWLHKELTGKGGKPYIRNSKNAEIWDREAAQRPDDVIPLPCGKCQSCRLEHAAQWSTRCYLESLEHKHNQFLTLTYDDFHVPATGVSKQELSDFIRKVRDHYRYHYGHDGIRFFGCGEYGAKFKRPHYHVLLFNCPPWQDEKVWKKNQLGQPMKTSEKLNELWGKGICTIQDVTLQSAGYVARYALKKTGDRPPKEWQTNLSICHETMGLVLKHLSRITPNTIDMTKLSCLMESTLKTLVPLIKDSESLSVTVRFTEQ